MAVIYWYHTLYLVRTNIKSISSALLLLIILFGHAVEAGEAGPIGVSQIPRWESDATPRSTIVNPLTVSHDRTWQLSKNSGHCFETHTGSHLEGDETVSRDNTTIISHLTTANSSIAFHDSTRPPSKNLGHCLDNDTGSQLEDADTAMSSTIMVRNSNTQNPPVLIRPYRKVHTYHDERMNRLL